MQNPFCVAVGAGLLLVAGPAWAEGRFPRSNQIEFSPSDPNLVIARTTYGILPSRDNGATWQFLCEAALGLDLTVPLDPEIGLTKTNALVVAVTNDSRMGSYVGLDVSPDIGCSWNCIPGPLANQAVSDVVVRPDAPDVVLAVTSTYLPLDAGGGAHSQVFESTDDGAHWSPLGPPLDPLVIIQTIEVAKTDPSRIYLSGVRVGPPRTASLFVMTDGDAGKSWTEHQLTMFDPATEEFIWLAGVDPMDADRVYLRSNAPMGPGGRSRLFVTTDAGKSFQVALEFAVPPLSPTESGGGELLGFALSPDGSKVYAGNKQGHLFMASRAGLNFQLVNPSVEVECLATRGNELWACSEARDGFVIGVSTDDGAHFCPKMTQVASITGPIQCAADTPATVACGATVRGSACQSAFDTFCAGAVTRCQADCPASFPPECQGSSNNDGATCDSGPTDDSGPGPGGAGGDGAKSTATKSSGCGCSTPGGEVPGGLLALVGPALVAWARGSFRQQRPRRRSR